MATINNGINFIFAGESSLLHGVQIVSSIGSTSFTNGDESRSLITSKNPFRDVFDLHYVDYDSPLEFEIVIMKTDGSYMDANDERRLKKWLLKRKREWLQIDQTDLSDCYYRILITQAEKVEVSTYNAGLKLHCVCDAPWAWSGLRKKTYTTVNNTLSLRLNMDIDFDEYIIHPSIIFNCLASGTISVANTSTNETITINNCTQNEEIQLNCNTDMIKSSTGRVLIDDWNRNTLGFIQGGNNLTLTGNFTMTLQYRLPIRVGG